MKLMLALLVFAAGVIYVNFPDAETAQDIGSVVVDFIKYLILPKPIVPQTYMELFLAKIGYTKDVEETLYYSSWFTDGYIYLAIGVTFVVYVLYAISMIYLLEWPVIQNCNSSSKLSDQAMIADENNNNQQQQSGATSTHNASEEQQHIDINDDKVCKCNAVKEIQIYQTIIEQLEERSTDLQETYKKQDELLSRAGVNIRWMERERVAYWVGFIVMALFVLIDVMYKSALLY